MKKIISTILLCTFAAATFAFSSPSKVQIPSKKNSKAYPDWVFSPYNYYSEAKYLCGVGLGSDLNAAEEDAKAELLKVLKQSIDAVQNVKSYADAYTDSSVYTQEINATTGIKNISGIEIEKKYTASDSEVYALAVLNRQEACDNYSKIIRQNDSQIAEYMNWAKAHPGDIQSAVYGQKALKLAVDNDYYIEAIRLIQPPYGSDTAISYGSYVQLLNDVTEIKKKIAVKVIVEGDVKGMAEASVKKVFEKIGVTCTDNDLDHTYLAVVGLELQKADSPDMKHFFCNYVYTVEIVNKNNKGYFTYSAYGRAGHLNEQGAKNKAMLLVTKDIESKFFEKLAYYAENGSQQ